MTSTKQLHRFEQLKIASSFKERLLGLTIYNTHPEKLAFMLPNCKLIHTFGMKYSIDLIFIDQNYVVTEIFEHVPACKIQGAFFASHTIELEAGSIRKNRISKGDLICDLQPS